MESVSSPPPPPPPLLPAAPANHERSPIVEREEPPDSPPTSPPIIPPYWHHRRDASYASIASNGRPPPITLEDHTEEDAADLKSPLWAKLVSIDSHVVVSGNVKGVGDYVVWNCSVQTLDGGSMTIRKRYSEFETLRSKLAATFPRAGSSLPSLPPKSLFYKFRPAFLEKRRAGLAYFLNCVLLNPEFSGSPVLKEFIFN